MRRQEPSAIKLSGWLNGCVGVLIFSGSLPATRVAVLSVDPLFLTAIRAVGAAVLALGALFVLRAARPRRSDLVPLAIVAAGVVIGFPLLSALALRHMTAAYSLVFVGLLPLATAIFGALRGGERPRLAFWICACIGSALVAGFALTHAGSGSWTGDGLMLAAIVVCGLGYAEGAVLSRRLGGWQVISWALVLALPLTLALLAFAAPGAVHGIGLSAWIAVLYVTVGSMWIGFVFWYRGLAQGGIAAVGQLQLLQPFLGLGLAGLLLRERVEPSMVLVAIGVVLSVAAARHFAR